MTDYNIIGLNYVTMYLKDYEEAVAFYTQIFGPPPTNAPNGLLLWGWQLGSTWLTIFPSQEGTQPDSNPRNAEFAIQVGTPADVDRLHAAFIAAGAKDAWTPENTEMYEPMRFSCVDDPFGMRIDVYCPIEPTADSQKE